MEFLIENLMKKVYFIDFGFSNKISFKSFSKMPIFTHVYTTIYNFIHHLYIFRTTRTELNSRTK